MFRFAVIYVLLYVTRSDATFDPNVRATCEHDVAVCEVTLTIERYQTNTIIDYEDRSSAPMVIINGQSYYRANSLDAACDEVYQVSNQGR